MQSSYEECSCKFHNRHRMFSPYSLRPIDHVCYGNQFFDNYSQMDFKRVEYWSQLHKRLRKAHKFGKLIDLSAIFADTWMGGFSLLTHLCMWTCGIFCASPCLCYMSYRKDYLERKRSIETHLTAVYGDDWKDTGKMLHLMDCIMPILMRKAFTLSMLYHHIDGNPELTDAEKLCLKAGYGLLHPYDNLEVIGSAEYQRIS